MISHDRAQELISARMDAPLTPAEHHELQSHLASCHACRAFVFQIDDMARGLHGMPQLPPSPAVSRAVRASISSEAGSWGWLQHMLQALSSPGMAVASSMALILALGGALFVALNAPGPNGGTERAAQPEGTIAAVAVAPLPTEVPTTAAAIEPTAVPTEPPAPEPTATRGPGRTIAPAPTREAEETPTPRPTATRAPIVEAAQDQPASLTDSPAIEPVDQAPVYEEPAAEEPILAMASDEASGAAELAQEAITEEPIVEEQLAGEPVVVDEAPVQEIAEPAPDAMASEPVVAEEPAKDAKTASANESSEPEATRPIGPVPIEAIAALEGAGNAPDISLPPAPLDPMLPNQDFLPVTPTPVPDWEGTPTPESPPLDESQAPQLAEDPSADLGLAGLAPETIEVAEAPVVNETESEKSRRGKREKSDESGRSHENQQSAYVEAPFGWSSDDIDWQGTLAEPAELYQTTEYPDATAGTTGTATEPVSDPAAVEGAVSEEPVREIDPATGMEIDPATGYLIDPTTGYLLDRVNGRIIDPRTSYEVHPMTGLLIDPATGALLDPNTLAVVVPPGFGSDEPGYVPGSPDMRGQIETVVDDTYNNASIKLEPPTDGPVQPIGEIIVPTESGEALEIS